MLLTRLRFYHDWGNNYNNCWFSSLSVHSYIYICVCVCVRVHIYWRFFWQGESIAAEKHGLDLRAKYVFCYDTSPLKGSPQSCRLNLDTFVLIETTWTLNSRVYKVLWPAGTSTRVLQWIIAQKLACDNFQTFFSIKAIRHFPSNDTSLPVRMFGQWMNITLVPTRPSAILW